MSENYRHGDILRYISWMRSFMISLSHNRMGLVVYLKRLELNLPKERERTITDKRSGSRYILILIPLLEEVYLGEVGVHHGLRSGADGNRLLQLRVAASSNPGNLCGND